MKVIILSFFFIEYCLLSYIDFEMKRYRKLNKAYCIKQRT